VGRQKRFEDFDQLLEGLIAVRQSRQRNAQQTVLNYFWYYQDDDLTFFAV